MIDRKKMQLPGEILTTLWCGRKSAEASVSRTKYRRYFDAVRMMRAGPSESSFRRGFQTTFMLLCLRDMVVSDKGKGHELRDQVSIKETNESEPFMRRR